MKNLKKLINHLQHKIHKFKKNKINIQTDNLEEYNSVKLHRRVDQFST